LSASLASFRYDGDKECSSTGQRTSDPTPTVAAATIRSAIGPIDPWGPAGLGMD
jgi:hypothetical protein